MVTSMGIELLTEEQYRDLQMLGEFDLKTSSWVRTPAEIRKLGGAIFCDRRYNKVFTYHNGADSYYAARGFRGMLKVQILITLPDKHSGYPKQSEQLLMQLVRTIVCSFRLTTAQQILI